MFTHVWKSERKTLTSQQVYFNYSSSSYGLVLICIMANVNMFTDDVQRENSQREKTVYFFLLLQQHIETHPETYTGNMGPV